MRWATSPHLSRTERPRDRPSQMHQRGQRVQPVPHRPHTRYKSSALSTTSLQVQQRRRARHSQSVASKARTQQRPTSETAVRDRHDGRRPRCRTAVDLIPHSCNQTDTATHARSANITRQRHRTASQMRAAQSGPWRQYTSTCEDRTPQASSMNCTSC